MPRAARVLTGEGWAAVAAAVPACSDPLIGDDMLERFTQAQQAARNIMRYFDIAGPHHHADEEQDLFPLLIEASERLHSPVGERIASLLDEHRVLEASWAHLRTVLADIAAVFVPALISTPKKRVIVFPYGKNPKFCLDTIVGLRHDSTVGHEE